MSVPLIISGNIYSLEEAIEARRKTGAEAVMVTRGGVGNPFLLTQIDRYFRTGERLPNPTVSQQIDWCYQLADGLYRQFREDIATGLMRGFAPKFISGCHRCRGYRLRLATGITDRDSLVSIMEEIRSRMGSESINTGGIRHRPDGTVPPDP
jgi:tRNA-dihydrouridine synthase B